jgi:hypothetical protein
MSPDTRIGVGVAAERARWIPAVRYKNPVNSIDGFGDWWEWSPAMNLYPRLLMSGASVAILLAVSVCSASELTDPNALLAGLLKQYQLPRTFHCEASIAHDFKMIPPGIVHVDGTQEYWADGGRYRILQVLDTPVFPGMSQDVRWDGNQFQWFSISDGTLIISRRAKQKTPYIAEPIPLLPVSFLNPSGDDLGIKLSLAELRTASAQGRLPKAHFVGPDHSEIELPGGTIGPTEFVFRIQFGGEPNYLPRKFKEYHPPGFRLVPWNYPIDRSKVLQARYIYRAGLA